MKFARAIGRFPLDGIAVLILMAASLFLAGKAWLHDHPQHDPWAALDLSHQPGWATQRKLASLRSDPEECRAVLERSGIAFTSLDPAGEGACRREDRTVLGSALLRPAKPASTCAVAAGLEYWVRHGLNPVAEEVLGSPVTRIEHMGTANCRRIYGREEGAWSEHATGNAIDIAAFVLEDGRRISVLNDWPGEEAKAEFLHRARDSACQAFGTVLSPDYNAAHADHLHLDQEGRAWGSVCR